MNILKERTIPRQVWFLGTGALIEGQSVCYDRDYVTTDTGETATDNWGKRGNVVNLPSNSNNNAFAGVVARAYAAKTEGQLIEIYEPGSICNIYVTGSQTIGEMNFVTAIAGGANAGYFGSAGFQGRGTARLMQTRTGAGLVLAELLDGAESGLCEDITSTGGAFTAMVGGVTRFPANALGSDATNTLANGTIVGGRKRYLVTGTQVANNVVITVTSGVQLNGTTALATVTLDDINDDSLLEWCGQHWKLLANNGSVLG